MEILFVIIFPIAVLLAIFTTPSGDQLNSGASKMKPDLSKWKGGPL